MVVMTLGAAIVAVLTVPVDAYDVSSFFGHRRIHCGSVARWTHTQLFQPSGLPSTSELVMKVKVGILGLPNVGKSTLFNTLARKSVANAANFPFCTIDPNVATVPVPDPYLRQLGQVAGTTNIRPATMEWIDVAGLARGAHRGEGLGNRFLATLRECSALVHLIRAFEDPDVVHVDGAVDPVADGEAINLELLLADLAHVERRLEKTTCTGLERVTLETLQRSLVKGVPARTLQLSGEELFSIKSMGLLTLKPVVYAFNVDEVDFLLSREEARKRCHEIMTSLQHCDPHVDLSTIVSPKLEAELSVLESRQERWEYLESLVGLGDDEANGNIEASLAYNSLPLLIQTLLSLGIVYTGPGVPPERSQTTKAHLLVGDGGITMDVAPMNAYEFAGRLHGDIQKGFLCAEVTSAPTILEHSTHVAAKDAGSVRTEGRDYVLQPKDVVLIKWKGG